MTPVPYNFAAAITPSDTVNISLPGAAVQVSAVYVGGAGAVVAVYQDGTTATFAAVPVGTVLPISVKRINSTSTTATNLLALYRL